VSNAYAIYLIWTIPCKVLENPSGKRKIGAQWHYTLTN